MMHRARNAEPPPMPGEESGLLLDEVTMAAIQAEATRAYLVHGCKSMFYGTDERKFAILAEEVGEVARELNEAVIHDRPVDKDRLVKELIQVAAMAATWVQALEGGIRPSGERP